MGIGPVVGVRPVTMIKPSPRSPDLTGVFAVEFRGQQGDESYAPSHQRAARGLEDEETDEPLSVVEEDMLEEASPNLDRQSEPPHQVSFFA
jgi:hypothetical protein